MSDDFKVVRTREEYLGMIALFKTIGINAIFGGTKGDGFWLQNAATGETITDPLNRSGNPAFWMWDDAVTALVKHARQPFEGEEVAKDVKTVREFVAKYHKPGRGAFSIESYEQEFNQNGYTFISPNDSITGKTIVFIRA